MENYEKVKFTEEDQRRIIELFTWKPTNHSNQNNVTKEEKKRRRKNEEDTKLSRKSTPPTAPTPSIAPTPMKEEKKEKKDKIKNDVSNQDKIIVAEGRKYEEKTNFYIYLQLFLRVLKICFKYFCDFISQPDVAYFLLTLLIVYFCWTTLLKIFF